MYNKIILNKFIEHKNSGRISKPDGIADIYNADETAHVEFSLRIENENIANCQFRAQANPYIIAVCSTIADLVAGSDINEVMVTPQQIKDELQDNSDIDIDFCFDCLRLAIDDYFESNHKEKKIRKPKKTEESSAEPKLVDILNLLNNSIDESQEKTDIFESQEEDIVESKEEIKKEEMISNLGLNDDDFIFDDDDMLDFGVDFMTLKNSDKK
ncbi:MAG: iron-sulfur cluster assembly scaffold protein [Clostridia bacterium]|nr:iron-sulfur cluster assembly scaffold protein [Clostridia bacterium]